MQTEQEVKTNLRSLSYKSILKKELEKTHKKEKKDMKPLVCESQFQNPNKEIQSIKKVAREKDNIQKPYDE